MKYNKVLFKNILQLAMSITLPPLPYSYSALEPHISEKTLQFHHDKHHKKYVDTTNDLIKGTELQDADLVTIIKAAKENGQQPLLNNAGQSWNHSFYWECMKPGGGGAPSGPLLELIEQAFGSFDAFRTEFSNVGTTLFGSGWAWLVWTPSGVKIVKTKDGDAPFASEDCVPLLTMDVWEHAYYLDYQNVRASYVTAFLDNLVNWDFVTEQLPSSVQGAKQGGSGK